MGLIERGAMKGGPCSLRRGPRLHGGPHLRF